MNHQNFLEYLPLAITVDIISRLPVRTILICKHVCSSWRNLLKSDYFVQYHLSKSLPGLAVQFYGRVKCEIYKSVERNIHNRPIQRFALNMLYGCGCSGNSRPRKINGSVDGLLFVSDVERVYSPTIQIVNPTTREIMKIECSQLSDSVTGFGVSRKNGQYKVVRISGKDMYGKDMKSRQCEVYTLGTGSWRSFSIPPHYHNLKYISYSFGAFVKGNIHWLVYDLDDRLWISCFDVESDRFSIFASPPLPPRQNTRWKSKWETLRLCALDDYLWLFDSSNEKAVTIWWLKDYEDMKSWKKFVMTPEQKHIFYIGGCVPPVMVSEDGESLVASTNHSVFHYLDREDLLLPRYSVVHKCSFLSLKSFANEEVTSWTDSCLGCSKWAKRLLS